jgi:hypothetical protein
MTQIGVFDIRYWLSKIEKPSLALKKALKTHCADGIFIKLNTSSHCYFIVSQNGKRK